MTSSSPTLSIQTTNTLFLTATTQPTEEPVFVDALVQPPPIDSGPCGNVLYPMIPGNEWIYQITTSEDSSQIGVTVTQVNGNQATLNALYLDNGITSETTIDCDDGAILNIPIVLLGFIYGDLDGFFEIEHINGVFLLVMMIWNPEIGIMPGREITLLPERLKQSSKVMILPVN